ncbi:unnamed protein product [Acanthoscelides obtectus]|uniref:Uncharacterized protein n=1 Tax=Acanthoscelides obtectus TaxID=200917 RepID=A0A9P0QBH7_ACAOB|nr:unnamed protein product [Acanthoscelides obtectus]CAK1630803.1 hypothetical protein AOBTE_LOCUS6563 [Acanthoscelides obtectus]
MWFTCLKDLCALRENLTASDPPQRLLVYVLVPFVIIFLYSTISCFLFTFPFSSDSCNRISSNILYISTKTTIFSQCC